MKVKDKKWLYAGGNMTLEAAIIVPMIMLIILLIVKTSVDLHAVNKNKSIEYIRNIEESESQINQKRKSLYKYKIIKDEIDKFEE